MNWNELSLEHIIELLLTKHVLFVGTGKPYDHYDDDSSEMKFTGKLICSKELLRII